MAQAIQKTNTKGADMEYDKNFIELKTIYASDYSDAFLYTKALGELFEDGIKKGIGDGWYCIQSGRLKNGVRFHIFMREIAE